MNNVLQEHLLPTFAHNPQDEDAIRVAIADISDNFDKVCTLLPYNLIRHS